jgi:hypothetical protein
MSRKLAIYMKKEKLLRNWFLYCKKRRRKWYIRLVSMKSEDINMEFEGIFPPSVATSLDGVDRTKV